MNKGGYININNIESIIRIDNKLESIKENYIDNDYNIKSALDNEYQSCKNSKECISELDSTINIIKTILLL